MYSMIEARGAPAPRMLAAISARARYGLYKLYSSLFLQVTVEYGPVRMVAFWHVLLPFGAVSISVIAQMNRRIMGLIMTARSGRSGRVWGTR